MKSWTHSAANAAVLAYGLLTLSNVAVIITILSGLASLVLTLITIRKTLREGRNRRPGDRR
jgi:hypothetical protein